MPRQSFDVEAAVHYGLTEALVLQCLRQLLDIRTNAADYEVREGCCWIKLTLKQLLAIMPYSSVFKIKGALELLESAKLIRVYQEDVNGLSRKRKIVSYTLTERGQELTCTEDEHGQK